jgi:predicted acylesterase/phospholipase RssA
MHVNKEAQAVIDGGVIPVGEVQRLARDLRIEGRTALVGQLLTAVARRALDGRWNPDERAELAIKVLRDHQQFNYARRLLGSVRRQGPDSELLRQQHALCTYKDLELPAARRLEMALRILESDGPLDTSTDAETLGIAGAIYKRRWEVGAKSVDLENALWCYRRGFAQESHPERWYAGINAAFVADRLADLEKATRGGQDRAVAFRQEADDIRNHIVDTLGGGDREWHDSTIGEALFGLGKFPQAREKFAAVASRTLELWKQETTATQFATPVAVNTSTSATALWKQETTATQLATLANLRDFSGDPQARLALAAIVGGNAAATRRVTMGKVGLALSGGGYRASLFHIGVLARLAECKVLRHVEVLSCVSGGSIVGAYYYLKLRRLLQNTRDEDVTDDDYLGLVREVADEFLKGVRRNLRGRLLANVSGDVRMLLTKYSLSDRAGVLLEEQFYGQLRTRTEPGTWRMPNLLIAPAGRGPDFSLRYENWMRQAKVPILVLNATTLNTGHSWQFTATWMGEPPSMLDERTDASRRLRRTYYHDAPTDGDLRRPTLGKAVAASACVPGLFPPVTFSDLYDGVDVELVDGGVHDNQGIAALLEQDCTILLVSDASGQLRDSDDPKRLPLGVLLRTNNISMKRIRGMQYGDLLGRKRNGTLRGFMSLHLTKGLPADPRNWRGCPEPWEPADDDLPSGAASPYGIDPDVQWALSVLRTDLDDFSDDEAFGLMATGYLMTRTDLRDALPELSEADPAFELGEKWPFWPTLSEMTSPDASRLAESLGWGHTRFFRGPRAWWGRQREGIPFLRARRK